MKSVFSTLLVLVIGILNVSAQDDGTAEAATPKGRVVWIATTSIPDDLENPAMLLVNNKPRSITLSKRMSSGPIKIPQDGIIRMVRENPDQDSPDAPPYLTLAQARIPENVNKALVILIPVAKKPGSDLMFQSKVQSLAGFKGGDNLYMNLTNVDVAVKLGDKSLRVKPGKYEIWQSPTLAKSTTMPVSYHYYHPVQEAWKLLSASTVVVRPTRREICIFSWDERYQRVRYHGVTFPVGQ